MEQIILKPFRCAQVEMIRRLVQKKYIRVFKYKPGEIYPRPFSAGKTVKKLLTHMLRYIKTVGNAVAIDLHFITAEPSEILGKAVIFAQNTVGRVRFHRLGKLFEPVVYSVQPTVSILKHILGRPIGRINGYL